MFERGEGGENMDASRPMAMIITFISVCVTSVT